MKKQTALDFFGSAKAIATILGCSRHAVYMWRDVVPIGAAARLQIASRGRCKVDKSVYRNGQHNARHEARKET